MSSVLLIVKPEHVTTLRKKFSSDASVVVVSETESLAITDHIADGAFRIVAIAPAFAATSRAAALIAKLHGRARRSPTEVRILIEDDVGMPVLLDRPVASAEKGVTESSRAVSRLGTRQTIRFTMRSREVSLNGEPGELLDLSTAGAQVASSVRMQPSEVVRLMVAPDLKCRGRVIWVLAAPSATAIRYRAGMTFLDPDAERLQAFCATYGDPPDRRFGPT